ncbi:MULTISPECIES: hypothetical protein [Staphylococcus]|uniref:hypothetical protein n=1 Tax=Staphylococcus TaxID=1279 RepID=UPI0034C60E6B
MDIINHYSEELDSGLNYLKTTNPENLSHFQDKGFHKSIIKDIKLNIEQLHKYMLKYLNDLSKEEIEIILGKIVESEKLIHQKNV